MLPKDRIQRDTVKAIMKALNSPHEKPEQCSQETILFLNDIIKAVFSIPAIDEGVDMYLSHRSTQ